MGSCFRMVFKISVTLVVFSNTVQYSTVLQYSGYKVRVNSVFIFMCTWYRFMVQSTGTVYWVLGTG